MESTFELKITDRKMAIETWLSQITPYRSFSLQPLPHDASFRRYYRLYISTGSFIVMDAPPEKENCRAYVALARALRKRGLNVPEIIAENLTEGFLLISDFGDLTYLKTLKPDNADMLYQRAMDALLILQHRHEEVPHFSRDLMWQEWAWFKEWFLRKLLNCQLRDDPNLEACYEILVESATLQPQVLMHRDYHSANLMVLPNEEVGILDFQDAFIGPLTYDLASLLRDCYISWPEDQVREWAERYRERLQKLGIATDSAVFIEWFDKMSIQRHIKALVTFSRKAVRDKQHQYLNHVPRTLTYLTRICRPYAELSPLFGFLQEQVIPAYRGVDPSCEL